MSVGRKSYISHVEGGKTWKGTLTFLSQKAQSPLLFLIHILLVDRASPETQRKRRCFPTSPVVLNPGNHLRARVRGKQSLFLFGGSALASVGAECFLSVNKFTKQPFRAYLSTVPTPLAKGFLFFFLL